MKPEELKSARQGKGWTQHGAAGRLGVSQSYLAMLESGTRQLPAQLARRVRKVYDLPPTALPLPQTLNVKFSGDVAQTLAKQFAALGYEGFAYLRSHSWRKNPAEVLVKALAQPELEARLVEALPWLLVRYPDVDTTWLVEQSKRLNLQNRLGFVTALARRVVEQQHPGDRKRVRSLKKLEEALEPSKLAQVSTLSKASLGTREQQWLEENRSEEAKHWNLLTDWKPEMLPYAAV